ncbi:MAG: hypothetical protein HY751_08985 [Nitrospinae bacterium]|nr:hypothetical protein [Nitrospinota bacterium]
MRSTFKRLLPHTNTLAPLLRGPVTLENLDAGYLKSLGAKVVILDHDGVLGPIWSATPDATGSGVIEKMLEAFGDGRVFVLSNTKRAMETRKEAYGRLYPKVNYLVARRKPDPEGLMMASRAAGVEVSQIAVVDDGVLTGILMAVENGAIPVYVLRASLEDNLITRTALKLVTLPQAALARLAIWLKPLIYP